MQIGLILPEALLLGLSLSVVLALIMGASLAIAPDMWVGDYPPDIREKYGEMSERGRRYRPAVAVLFFGAILLVVGFSSVRLHATLPTPPTFVHYLLANWAILMVFNLFDLLVADWLIFVTIQPKAIVLPGTDGMPGHKDYRFHFRAFLTGLVFSTVAAAVFAGIAAGAAAVLR